MPTKFDKLPVSLGGAATTLSPFLILLDFFAVHELNKLVLIIFDSYLSKPLLIELNPHECMSYLQLFYLTYLYLFVIITLFFISAIP